MKKISYYFALIIALSFVHYGCGDDDPIVPQGPTSDLVEIAVQNGFSSLAAALTKAGLVDDLQGSTDFTVFAPTNEAFSNLLTAIGQSSIDDVPASVLEQILLHHVVPGRVLSTDIVPESMGALSGESLSLNTTNGVTVNGVAVINPFDVEATNGVIHAIDEVLVPTGVAQFVNTILAPAYFNESFSTLIEAAVKAEVVDFLLTTDNLTIFAPDNDAFEASNIDPNDLEAEALASVLTYHVVGAKVMSTEIPREAMTVNGNAIFFSLASSGNFVNGATEIKQVDIESGTGVIHVLNRVILPPTGNLVETAIDFTAGGEFTSLVAALTRTVNEGTDTQNLINVLNGSGPFTVFAPTNAAFQALLDGSDDWNALEDIPLETLISVLSYHVVPALAFDKDLEAVIDMNNELPTALGQNIKFDLTNLLINNSSAIIDVNYLTTNGVIHVIDQVLLPS